MYVGWMQVAFESDLTEEVVPVDVEGRALIAVREDSTCAVYDGRCPHRGAHLGYGGRLDRTSVVCGFHGHRIHLGDGPPTEFHVSRHTSLLAAGGLFVLIENSRETGLPDRLEALSRSHYVRPAFSRVLSVPPEYVIENALDADHFAAVHALERRPRFEVTDEASGVLRVEGSFDLVRPNKWQEPLPPGAAAQTRFSAQIFSPTVVVSELGPAEAPSVVITAATPTTAGGCVARVTVALPRQRASGPPTVGELSSLVSGSRTAFDQDTVIWEHLDASVPPRYTQGDEPVRRFRDYCRGFLGPSEAPGR